MKCEWSGQMSDPNDILRHLGEEALRDKIDGAVRWNGEAPSIANGEPDKKPAPQLSADVKLEDFYAYMPDHTYIFAPTREFWAAASINARIPWIEIGEKPVKPTDWLDRNRPVETMTWYPGFPMVIPDKLMLEGGFVDHKGVNCFNLYRPPERRPGRAAAAVRWLDHLRKIYPDDWQHIVNYFAHCVQNPHEKINHALVLGGTPGIGKDMMIAPLRDAVGPWNFMNVSPKMIMGRFTGHLRSVVLRISEAHDLGDSGVDRFALYEHLKTITAAPPETHRIDEKNRREYDVFNVNATIITTNHLTDGVYLPEDDRRHYVAWSDAQKEDFTDGYWTSLKGWFDGGGIWHVAAYLAQLNISGFNPKAPPPKTAAFWQIVAANADSQDAELLDAIERMGNPDAFILPRLIASSPDGLREWLRDRNNRRRIGHRLDACGYVSVRNDVNKGLWVVTGSRQVIYAKKQLPDRERKLVAQALAEGR